jgi:hypothetical protein
MLSVRPVHWRGIGLACMVGLAGLLAVGDAHAAAPGWLRKALTTHLTGRPKSPPVARYEIDSGGDFILDRSAPRPLIKFEDSPEVWALTVSRGPRGDLIYWNDLRQPLVRMTKFGGVTVFTPRRPEGSAASLAGPAPPLRLQSLGWVALTQRLLFASTRSGHAAQHSILFEAPDADAADDALIADAALVVSEAMAGLAVRPGGRTLMGRITRVYLTPARQPDASVRDNTLVISVTPTLGLAGRPSSLRVQQALGARTGAVYIGVTR